jgi:hypothetical protein
MEIRAHPYYPTQFLLGHRMVAGTAQSVGAVIVKGTFQDMDRPTPPEQQVPIFLKDVPFNYVRNGDFESLEDGLILDWAAEGGTVTGETSVVMRAAGGWAKLHSTSRQAYLTQTLTLDQPVGGRTFVLSFYARAARTTAASPLTVGGFRLQAVGSGRSICQISARLTNRFERIISPTETWPADETGTEIAVILPGSGDSTNDVYFDRVQVEESVQATRWDEETVFQYEHDLVPYKPHADIVILSPATGPSTGSSGEVLIDTDTGQHLAKPFAAGEAFPIKALLGWAPRGKNDRLTQAGINLAAFNPRERTLPDGFDNRFYNGYDRALTGGPPAYLSNGTRLTITSDLELLPTELTSPFQVQLPNSRPIATLTVLNEAGQKEAQNLPLVLDTLIIEPELDRYLVVWRGTWLFDEDHKEKYIALTITGGP